MMEESMWSEPGPALPRRGGRLTRWLARRALRAAGWRFAGELPDLPKAVIIVAPHSSNWDFLVGIAAVFALGIRVAFLGKASLFRLPLGPLMRWLGGIPVDRSASHGVVEDTVQRFRGSRQLLLGLSPEGTRKQVERWKTGFYHIAHGAGVPIVAVALDYQRRTIHINEMLTPSGDLDADLARLHAFYSAVVAAP